jgi:hypothetical protein
MEVLRLFKNAEHQAAKALPSVFAHERENGNRGGTSIKIWQTTMKAYFCDGIDNGGFTPRVWYSGEVSKFCENYRFS